MQTGVSFSNAKTPFPSDSFPGMVAQVTGGNPKSTGVYYDDSWNRAVYPAGTTSCSGPTGAEVTYFEQLDKDLTALDAGQGLPGLPDSILNMTSNPVDVIDPAQLPVDAGTCKPIYPNKYIKVNTVFEVARAAGLRTAWTDKHPAYQILAGPSGAGVQDFFAPEINSTASVAGSDWTKDNGLTQRYDGYKVQSVLNEIAGFDHSGRQKVGTPAIFGMNFQSVSTAEKLPSGGYMADGVTPSALLEAALDFVNSSVASMQAAIDKQGLRNHTTIILSAKHGQSPDDPSKLTRINDGAIVAAMNAAWNAAGHAGSLDAFEIDDDGWLMWTKDNSAAEQTFAATFLANCNSTNPAGQPCSGIYGNDIQGNQKAFTSAGLDPAKIYSGSAAAGLIGVATDDPRVPDVIGIAQVGTVYTGGHGKIAEHGGGNPQDQHVPIVIAGAGVAHAASFTSAVETTQIAPTILELLGLDPSQLLAVQQEGTAALPH
ncbi:MAG TPA: alkaline phosphatase family protein [Candidatus Dormibacteraeota bacterium]